MNPTPPIARTTSAIAAKSKKPTQSKPTQHTWHDPFIKELHETRRKLLTKADNNMHQLVQNARETAVKHGFAKDSPQRSS